ncbi:hypothetical protein L0Z13_16385 [Burkholderia multivorans]|uniref:Uncharacterized protein n=1 Tax=Burkholderia multivorans CGD2 TaxID=513052 RepID=B9BXG6_9BURK|nr:hypothetical protein [Burkholderia multivorans]AJY19565.1 hypothetical protein NP80_700 [Burkholderia multivorans ATCC BAA-247]AVR21141.1 hypothetical protein A8H40_16905 [Burkholderia multivorans]EEE04396.1 conserved hypothetical protein [Burkholderia multivorans CGD2]EEE10081.1 conserved hypothetical protein [Burkholderia multivorans CGD2M]EJO60058.1 hypothetical protein BURMUCF1_0355 [Burkholderia multivorans ATCC BAA-247]
MSLKSYQFDASAIRNALTRIEDTSQENLVPPPLSTMYLPPAHAKALSLSASVVVGLRGTGKSYWTAVLNSKVHRDQAARAGRLPELLRTDVAVGFALDPSSQDFPSTATLSKLIQSGVSPDDVWQTVVLVHALRAANRQSLTHGAWETAIRWFAGNRDEGLALLAECDREIQESGRVLLVLFDALDRVGSDWYEIRQYLQSLLKFCLQCRSRRAIRLKIFLRPDMEEDEEVWNFVDSSKLRANRVEISWRAMDLFGLILLYLANDQYVGDDFRAETSRVSDVEWQEVDDIYQLPRTLGANEQPARAIIEAITGPWMGTSAKRGYVYTWIPTHLADAKGRLSPRSFLLAFREAAEWTEQHESDNERALNFNGIHQGVTKASEIRVGEISEDYPWVRPLLEAARGLTVPCEISDLTGYWKRDRMAQFRRAVAEKLPPRRYGTDPLRKETTDALIEDLVELAILYRTEDDRLNIPDIFRVGFGIRRKGGVRPPK